MTTRKFLGHKETLEIIGLLIEITEIIGTTKKEIIQALQNNFSDYENSVQYPTSLAINDIDAIIIHNIKDYRYSAIAVMTPLNFLKMKEIWGICDKNKYCT